MADKGSKAGCWIAITILALMLFGSFITNIGLVAALFSGPAGADGDHPVDERPQLDEIWSYGDGDTKVVRIALTGVIMHGETRNLFSFEPDMVESILEQIRAATLDEEVRAIILEVDSPGGAVTPSDEIYAALERFKQAGEERMVVVFIRDLGASGAYYASMAGDYIMAEPTAIVGSVGVIMQALNFKGLSDKLGMGAVTITSGENKDMLNPFEEVNPAHVAMLQEMINDMQERFAGIVQESRGFDSRELLDGRIFTASRALENGFIDGVGYWQDVLDKTKELLEADELYVVRYYKERGFFETLMESRLPQLPNLTTMESARFFYLWKP